MGFKEIYGKTVIFILILDFFSCKINTQIEGWICAYMVGRKVLYELECQNQQEKFEMYIWL